MSAPTQTLPDAPNGAVSTEPQYTQEQIAAFKALPSRAFIEDGTKNPFYNPKMDPGSDRWTPYEYFKAQPQVEVFVHPDPESPEQKVGRMSINGFELPYYPGRPQKMPRDFVELLKQRNHTLDIVAMNLVNEDDDGEGRLTLAVDGSMVKRGTTLKQFVREVTN